MSNGHNKMYLEKELDYSKKRIKSNLFTILFSVLLVSVFIQSFIFKSDFKQYFVELISVVFSGYYLVVANIRDSVSLSKNDRVRRKLIINLILTGLLVTLIFAVGYYFTYQEKYVEIVHSKFVSAIILCMFFISVFSVIAFLVIDGITQKRGKTDQEMEENR